MTTLEKQELVRLLSQYQSELVKKNEENIQKADNCKTQYEHAHCIIAKISVEIQKEMKSYWDL